jgi:Ca2+-binding EF-hand superfamily protein
MFGNPEEMIARVFEENDKDKDGVLSEDEIPERMAPMLRGADQDNDGAISKAEVTASMEQMRNRFRGGGPGGGFGPGGGGFNPQQMVQQFAQYDRNGDSKLTADEVPEQMRRMLQGADQNQDQAIDTQELQQAAQRMAERFGRGGERGFGDRGRGRGDDEAGENGDDERPSRSQRPRTEE